MNKFRNLLAVGLCGLALAFAAPVVEAQVTPTTIFVLTNLPTSLNGAAGAAVITNFFGVGNTNTPPSNNIISLRQGQGMAASLMGITGSGATVGFSLTWAVSLDGTNWSTLGNLQLSNALIASSTNVELTNYSSMSLNNELFITPASMEWAALPGTNITGILAEVSFGNIVPGGYP